MTKTTHYVEFSTDRLDRRVTRLKEREKHLKAGAIEETLALVDPGYLKDACESYLAAGPAGGYHALRIASKLNDLKTAGKAISAIVRYEAFIGADFGVESDLVSVIKSIRRTVRKGSIDIYNLATPEIILSEAKMLEK